jgi:hypothetical protein
MSKVKKFKHANTIENRPRLPSTKGEQSISGSQPHPESDDNLLEAVQKTGRYQDHSEENPKPLGE